MTGRRVQNERPVKKTQLDENIWSALDDHLQEKIIARLPVRNLFQAPSLSKSWRLRFRSESFRREVQSAACPRESYAPLFVSHGRGVVGYESSSKRWERFPTLSYLDRDLQQDWRLRAGDGPLLCWIRNRLSHANNDEFHVHVTNPIMKSWKQLPSRPHMHWPRLVHLVMSEGGKAYKVILGDLGAGGVLIELQIFDSSNGSWTLDSCNDGWTDGDTVLGGSAFVNGVLYMLVTVELSTGCKLVSFDVKQRTWKEIPYLCQVIEEDRGPHQPLQFDNMRHFEVVNCGLSVLLVVNTSPRRRICERHNGNVFVFRLDVERGLAFEVSGVPFERLCLKEDDVREVVGHGEWLYVGRIFDDCSLVIVYNVQTQEWHSVTPVKDTLLSFLPFANTILFTFGWSWTSFAYQPGLNPFLEV